MTDINLYQQYTTNKVRNAVFNVVFLLSMQVAVDGDITLVFSKTGFRSKVFQEEILR